MDRIFRKIACALVESADAKILLGRKDPEIGGVYPDCWQLPGGGIDPGESLLEAVKREVLEEVGLDLALTDFSLIDDQGEGEAVKILDTGKKVLCQMRFYVFQAQIALRAEEISIKPGDDFIEAAWFKKSELLELKLVPAGLPLFKRLGYF